MSFVGAISAQLLERDRVERDQFADLIYNCESQLLAPPLLFEFFFSSPKIKRVVDQFATCHFGRQQ